MKLKPRADLTIDLYFNGKTFTTRQRTDKRRVLAAFDPRDYDQGSVYRLAPNDQDKYVVVNKREPTKKANYNNIVEDTLYKYFNYFSISQLRDLNIHPWYDEIIPAGIVEMQPVFSYCQHVYRTIVNRMNYGKVLDIGCGSMGNYAWELQHPDVEQYIGLDIDLAKLHEGAAKVVSGDGRFSFVLLDIAHYWNKQNDRFPNDIWKTFYHNRVILAQKMHNIISIFSSQYANKSLGCWKNYVGEINFRSQTGTRLFIMWVDSDRITKEKSKSKYYSLKSKRASPAQRGTTDELTINLPHRPSHTEPALGKSQILNSFVNTTDASQRWQLDADLSEVDKLPAEELSTISQYNELVNWVVLVKL